MRKILLPGTDFEIPAIGFGCSALTGTNRDDALRLLDTAFDSGVRHFDVARYYGYGEAEGILRDFAKSRRSQITIATKFGIEPPRRTIALGMALRLGRRLVRTLPGVRTMVQKRSAGLVRTGTFSVEQARNSLQTSLRELGTDYVDLFLLHDYSLAAPSRDDLVDFLEGSVKAGKIRSFGIGTHIDDALRVLESQPELCRIVQFQNSVLDRNVDRLPGQASNRLVITHGALGGSYHSLLTYLKAHRDTARSWSVKLDVDCLQQDKLSALLLSYATEANPNGLVLFSSKSTARVRQNTRDVLERKISPTQIALFGELVNQELALIRSDRN